MANKCKANLIRLFLTLSLVSTAAQAQILIEDNGESVGSSVVSSSDYGYDGGGSYLDTAQLRRDRRAGIGLGVAGKLGLAGVNIELNFTPMHSVVVSFGGGSPFQSFAAEWKYLFPGAFFSPYLSGGYARWYNSTKMENGINDPLPSYLLTEFLSPEEQQDGQFALDFLTPSIGIQYHQLTGPYRGTAVYAEVVLLTNLQTLEPVPTGALGAYYYF